MKLKVELLVAEAGNQHNRSEIMYKKQAHQQYSSVKFSTADRGRLLMMMYDGALNFLRQAEQGIESGDISRFSRFLSKAQAVIAELQNTLDFEKGGDIAKDLDRLYDFMLFYLLEANVEKNAAKIGKVYTLLDKVAGAYRDILARPDLDLSEAEKSIQSKIPVPPTPAQSLSQEGAASNSSQTEERPRLHIAL